MPYKINDLTPLGRNLDPTDLLEMSLAGGTGSRKITGEEIIGGVVNPTSNIIPFNANGVLADSPLSYNGFNIIQTVFTNFPGNGSGGIQVTQNPGFPNSYFTTVLGDYQGTGGGTTLTVESNGGINGSASGGISFNGQGPVGLADVTQTNRVILGGSALQWNGTIGGPIGSYAFSIPIYVTGLGMTVNIPLYM